MKRDNPTESNDRYIRIYVHMYFVSQQSINKNSKYITSDNGKTYLVVVEL